jgi:hypothetical protein
LRLGHQPRTNDTIYHTLTNQSTLQKRIWTMFKTLGKLTWQVSPLMIEGCEELSPGTRWNLPTQDGLNTPMSIMYDPPQTHGGSQMCVASV